MYPRNSFYLVVGMYLLIPAILDAIDNPHFYRANFFWGEPRFERDWLTSFDLTVGTGSTKTARMSNGKKTALHNIFGFHNMKAVGSGVPGLDHANPLDKIVIDLAALPDNENFGKLLFKGRFRESEVVFQMYQNLKHGFFLQAHLPVRSFKLQRLNEFTDLCPTANSTSPNVSTPEWVNFLSTFDQQLSRHQIMHPDRIIKTGAGDLTLLLGWTWNYQDTCVFDYIDVSSKIGLLFSTSKQQNEDLLFDISFGYNGFWGTPVKFQWAFGAFDWFTMGGQVGALFFFDKTKEIRMKTDEQQNGFITLAKGFASIEQGTIWETSIYAKADHFAKGWSLLFGYTYTKKDRDCIVPVNPIVFKPSIVNSDSRYQSWRAHVLHFMGGYDFACDCYDKKPELYFFYTMVVGGTRIFDTGMNVLSLGMNIAWRW